MNQNQTNADLVAVATRRQVITATLAGAIALMMPGSVVLAQKSKGSMPKGKPAATSKGMVGGKQATMSTWKVEEGAYVVALKIGDKEMMYNVKADARNVAKVSEALKVKSGKIDIVAGKNKFTAQTTMVSDDTIRMQWKTEGGEGEISSYLADWAIVAIVIIVGGTLLGGGAMATGSKMEGSGSVAGASVTVSVDGGGSGIPEGDNGGDDEGDDSDNEDNDGAD